MSGRKRGGAAEAPAAPPTPEDLEAVEGALRPRETEALLGQAAAQAAFDAAWSGGRRHHAWLLRGPRGVGKATFAYGIARRILAENASLEEAARIARLVRIGAHPGLFELRRGVNERTEKARMAISVEDVRRLIGFFQLSAPDEGWRVALIDPADDLSIGAANALLKLLEEPPKRALFLLIAHAPGRLPATILSRCRRLDFAALAPARAAEALRAAAVEIGGGDAEALTALSGGSPGEALRLHAAGGIELYDAILRFLEAPREATRQQPLVEVAGRKARQPTGFETLSRLVPMTLGRLARARYRGAAEHGDLGGLAPLEDALAARFAPDDAGARRLAEAASELRDRWEAAVGLNLDPSRTIIDTALYLEEALAPRR
ncbi:MAG: DNA polymerase III subunit delta' [Pseudomonadota bacterium]